MRYAMKDNLVISVCQCPLLHQIKLDWHILLYILPQASSQAGLAWQLQSQLRLSTYTMHKLCLI